MKLKKFKCCICGETVTEWGNNPWPIKDHGKCCNRCNNEKVIPTRIMSSLGGIKHGSN